MTFHYPSFRHYFSQQFDISFNLWCHNWRCYLIPPNRYFTVALYYGFFADALIESLEKPLAAPRGARSRSLFEAPPEPHCEALREALREAWPWVVNIREIQTERGERLEYMIDLRVIRGIVQDVRRSEDCKAAERYAAGDIFLSERGIVLKNRMMNGRDIGKRRAREVMKSFEDLGYYHLNGKARTVGRELLKWPNWLDS